MMFIMVPITNFQPEANCEKRRICSQNTVRIGEQLMRLCESPGKAGGVTHEELDFEVLNRN